MDVQCPHQRIDNLADRFLLFCKIPSACREIGHAREVPGSAAVVRRMGDRGAFHTRNCQQQGPHRRGLPPDQFQHHAQTGSPTHNSPPPITLWKSCQTPRTKISPPQRLQHVLDLELSDARHAEARTCVPRRRRWSRSGDLPALLFQSTNRYRLPSWSRGPSP